ncbi:MAG TPA: hypothetical protein VJX67_15370 [Blastocatellia bacterium]|nr:hypothetical protein [Blastocatellia bacterium]
MRIRLLPFAVLLVIALPFMSTVVTSRSALVSQGRTEGYIAFAQYGHDVPGNGPTAAPSPTPPDTATNSIYHRRTPQTAGGAIPAGSAHTLAGSGLLGFAIAFLLWLRLA